MAQQRDEDVNVKGAPRTPGESIESRDFTPPDPAVTNQVHPTRPGERTAVPGEGVVSRDSAQEVGRQQTGFRDDVRPASPGAERPGTTDTAAFASPEEAGGKPTGIREFENPNASGRAPLSVPDPDPDRELPNSSAGEAAAETADPNYSAATAGKRRDPFDAGVTRMDTGNKGGVDNRSGAPGRARFVRDIMTADVNVCQPDTDLYYVARMMEERNVGIVPVVDSTDSMKVVGLITDRDIAIRAVAKNQDATAMKASDVMSTGVMTVPVNMPIGECVRLMEQRQVRRVPVVDETGRLVGIIAQADIARCGACDQAGDLVSGVSEDRGAEGGRYH